MLDSTSLATILLLVSASTLLLAAMLYPSALLRWFQRKRYQYEVTFSLYMLTSTEKFLFSTSLPIPSRVGQATLCDPVACHKTRTNYNMQIPSSSSSSRSSSSLRRCTCPNTS
jgi:hypothetical protein